MVLSNWDVVNFWDEFDLLLGGLVKCDSLAQCVHVVISKGLFIE